MKKIAVFPLTICFFLFLADKGFCQVADTMAARNTHSNHLNEIPYTKLVTVADTFKVKQQVMETTHQLAIQLGLSEEQVPLVEQVNFDYVIKMNNVYSSATSTVMPAEKIKAINDAHNKALFNVLTQAQIEKLKKLYPDN